MEKVKLRTEYILISAAPSMKNKTWFLEQLPEARLIVLMPPIWTCWDQMSKRDGKKGQLQKNIQRWYLKYQCHPSEETYERATDILD